MDEYIEDVCRKLRETAMEYGQEKLNTAIIIGNGCELDQVGGHGFIYAPTVGLTLAHHDWKMVRFFEDV